MLAPWKKSYDQSRQHVKKQRRYFANKGPSNQGYGFSNGHVWMWELDYTESWVLKNWCFWTVVLKKMLESPLDCKEIQPVHPKGDQSWVFIGRTDAEAEMPILWPPAVKSWLIGKDPAAGKDWRWEEKGMTEDEMAGWHHWLNGYEYKQALGDGDGQGSLLCCSPWGCKESDMTEWLNWTAGSSSLNRDWIQAPCIGSVESNHGTPRDVFSAYCSELRFFTPLPVFPPRPWIPWGRGPVCSALCPCLSAESHWPTAGAQ